MNNKETTTLYVYEDEYNEFMNELENISVGLYDKFVQNVLVQAIDMLKESG